MKQQTLTNFITDANKQKTKSFQCYKMRMSILPKLTNAKKK